MVITVLREISIGINFVEIVLLFEIFLLYTHNFSKEKFETRALTITALFGCFAFLCPAIARAFYMLYDYYIPEPIFVICAWIFLILGVFLIVIMIFKSPLGKAFGEMPYKNIYFIFMAVIIVLGLIFRIYTPLILVVPVIYAIGFILLIPLMYKFNTWIKTVGGYLINLRYALIAIPLCFFGMVIGSTWTHFPTLEIGYVVKITSHGLFLAGLILFAVSLWSLPSFSEIGWEDKLIQLYVILGNGICLYNYTFKGARSMDGDLIGGGLTGIVGITQEMTKSEKKLRVIHQEKSNILLDYGEHVTTVIIAEDDLKIIHDKMAEFTVEFEEFFEKVLVKWDGNIKIFSITETLVKRILLLESKPGKKTG